MSLDEAIPGPGPLAAPDRAARARGLSLFLWGFAGKEIASLLASLVGHLLPHLVSVTAEAAGWTLSDWYRLIWNINSGIQILGLVVCCVGLWRWSAAGRDRPGLLAMICYAVQLLPTGAWLVLRLELFDPRSNAVLSGTLLALMPLAEVAGLSLLVVSLGRAARDSGRPPSGLGLPIFILLGASLLLNALNMAIVFAGMEWFREHGWMVTAFELAWPVLSLALLGLVWLLVAGARRLALGLAGPVPAAGPGTALDQAPWPTVRRGVAAYRAGLIAAIWVAVLGGVLLVLAGLSRSPGMARGILVISAGAGLFTTGWMVFGLVGYAQVPPETGGRGPAVLTLALMVLSTLLGLFDLFLVFRILSDDYSTIRSAMRILPWIEGVIQVLGLLGALSLLFSFARVGRHVGSPDIARRVGTVAGLFGICAAGALLLRGLMAARALGAGGAIVLGLGMAVLAIVTLVMFLGVLKDFRRAVGAFGDVAAFE